MTLLAIWLLIWFFLNVLLIFLAIYLRILRSKKYLTFLENYAIKKHLKLLQPKMKKFKFNLRGKKI